MLGHVEKVLNLTIGLYQVSSLRPFIFATILDKITRPTKFYAYDIILEENTKDGSMLR